MARLALDPLHEFASDVEVPIGSCRAKMCAVHHLLESRDEPSTEVMDAVRQLIAEAWNTLDQMKARHDAAFTAAREART